MATKYHIRTDIVHEATIKTTNRNYLVEIIEAPTPSDLQNLVNAFLLALPTAIDVANRVHLVEHNNYVYGAGGGTMHVAVLTLYFSGLTEQLVIP
jgi:hypothetical protein